MRYLADDQHEDEDISNDDRALWAEVALLAFGQRTGLLMERIGDKEDAFFIVSDLLADLAHWCDRHKVEMPSALLHAAQHYWSETEGAGRQFNS